MEERITYGRKVKMVDVDAVEEIVTIEDVKDFLNMPSSISVHDLKISNLITTCREILERVKEVTLITEREVNVAWQQFYDEETLPYCPLKADYDIVVTDLSGETIDSAYYEVIGLDGFLSFKGEFPLGLKLSYTTAKGEIDRRVADCLVRAVAKCFENTTIDPYKAVVSEFKYLNVY